MCGRYLLQGTLRDIEDFYQISINNSPQSFDGQEVFPSQQAPVVVQEKERTLAFMRWGFVSPYVKPLIINGRSETVATKPLFAEKLQFNRCIVPASGFFEWMTQGGRKIKHLIQYADEHLMSLAGLYGDLIDGKGAIYRGFVILTTAAQAPVSEIHHRMPVLLDEQTVDLWLDENISQKETLSELLLRATVSSEGQLKLQSLVGINQMRLNLGCRT